MRQSLHVMSVSVCTPVPASSFEDKVDLEYIELPDFGLGPAVSGVEPSGAETPTEVAPQALDIAGLKKPVTEEVAFKTIRMLIKTKDTSRVEHCTKIAYRALLYGNTEARSVLCLEEAVQCLVELVAGRLPVFEYTEIYNASRTMSARDIDKAKVRGFERGQQSILVRALCVAVRRHACCLNP